MKAEKIFSRRKGFSLIELFVAMIIIALFTSFITTNITSQSQTAKAEAEKLAAYITGLARKADRRHINFTIMFNSDNAYNYFGSDTEKRTYIFHNGTIDDTYDKKIILSPGFSLKANVNKLEYDSNENEFNAGEIILTKDLDSTKSYIIIGDVDNGGRIRVSEDVS